MKQTVQNRWSKQSIGGPAAVSWLCTSGLLLSCFYHTLLIAQESDANPHVISLTEVKATPDSSLLVPLVLTAGSAEPLRSLTVDIEFVSKTLIFEKVSPGMAAEFANAQIQADFRKGEVDAKGLQRATLRVTVSLQETDPKEGLPEGLLAYLYFDVSPEAKPVRIRLTPRVVAAEDLSSPPKKVETIDTEPGLVIVESLDDVYDRVAPIACFFFMH